MAVVAVASGVAAASASAATITFTVPFEGTVINDCTGDAVVISGTTHVKETNNSSLASLKAQLEMNLTGAQGTTLTGARYTMNSQVSDMQHAEFDPLGNAQLTIEESTIMNRQGEAGGLVNGDDFRLHVLMHLTVTKGVVKAEKTELRADCR